MHLQSAKQQLRYGALFVGAWAFFGDRRIAGKWAREIDRLWSR